MVQEAANSDKKERYEQAAKERSAEEARIRAKDIARANATAAAAAAIAASSSVPSSSSGTHLKPAAQPTNVGSAVGVSLVTEEAALDDFFSDIDKPNTSKSSAAFASSSNAESSTTTPEIAAEDAALADFLSSVSAGPIGAAAAAANEDRTAGRSTTGIAGMDRQNGNLINEKYSSQDLGTAEEQADRLLQPNYQWKNLNPFYVLQLGIDATEEDIKQRYRKLSTRVHPDKLRGRENAREAFEEVR